MGSPANPLVGLQRCQQSSTVQEANDRKMQMYQVSIGGIMPTLGLLVFISILGSGTATKSSVFRGCMYAHYMVNETCFRCPENCTICVSDTNCTLCRKGFYGPVCENKCDFNCTGTCHKEYGHCTYGCPDGTYPSDDNSCQPCSSMCSLCASKSHCIDCKRSHFLDDGQCRPHDSRQRTSSATVLVVVTITVIVIFIFIAVLVICALYKRRSVIKKKNTNDTDLYTLENVELTIPLSTKEDEGISIVKAECIAGKDEIFSKSAFGAQPKIKPYDAQQLSPIETCSGIATAPNLYYQDSPQLAIKHMSTKSKAHVPYARPKSNTHDVRKEDVTSKLAHQIVDERCKLYM